MQVRYERARRAAQAAAEVLRQRFSARRVRLFGSALTAQVFRKRSDIDLAVEGIDPMMVLKAWCAASAVAPEFEFDLVTPDECRPEIWAAVEAEGVDL
jgi:predicted nucleotidyltransferase